MPILGRPASAGRRSHLAGLDVQRFDAKWPVPDGFFVSLSHER